jgi:DNA-binding FadR family transcriptional regulator
MTRQITDQLRSLIGNGVLAVGSSLPSERTLAELLGVARNVVRGSYEYLEKAGVVQRNGNQGRRVRAAPARRNAATRSSKKGAKKR